MKSLADVVALVAVVLVILSFIFSEPQWAFDRSPNTGICYEVEAAIFLPIGGMAGMSPVDDKYCE